MSLFQYEQWFLSRAERECAASPQDQAPMHLKIQHTLAVRDIARHIAQAEGFSEPLARAAELAALFHDVARFEQYVRFHTFKDSLSFNHALRGTQILKASGVLQGEAYASYILAAIAMHNRYAIPPHIQGELRLLAAVVRDADKLDILRVMREHLCCAGAKSEAVVLGVKDEPQLFSPIIVETALAGKLASYADLHYVNDFRLLLGTWIHDLHFSYSRQRLCEDGHVHRIMEELPDLDPLQKARRHLLCLIQRSGCSVGKT